MPAENMSGFMRQNAADLVGVICFQQRPRMDEQIVAVADKGIQAVVIDNINFIAVKRNTGSLKIGRITLARYCSVSSSEMMLICPKASLNGKKANISQKPMISLDTVFFLLPVSF